MPWPHSWPLQHHFSLLALPAPCPRGFWFPRNIPVLLPVRPHPTQAPRMAACKISLFASTPEIFCHSLSSTPPPIKFTLSVSALFLFMLRGFLSNPLDYCLFVFIMFLQSVLYLAIRYSVYFYKTFYRFLSNEI